MEAQKNQRAMELAKSLCEGQGVLCDPADDKLLVISYPKEDISPLPRFTKTDLESALELKLLGKAETRKVNDRECTVYMKTQETAGEN